MVTDQPETFLAAELLREKLLRIARDELPHSITVVAEEIEPGGDDAAATIPPPTTASCACGSRILVERDSQKGIVIGKGGAVLKEAGTLARESSRRCSAPASTSRPRSRSSATGNGARTPSTGSGSDRLVGRPVRPAENEGAMRA